MSSFLVRAHVEDVLRVLEVGREDGGRDAELEVRVLLGERLHRLDRLARLVEAALDVAHLIVDVADAVERHADADEQVVLRAELDDPREHRDRAMRRQAGRVDADLAHPRQMPLEHLDHLGQVVARRRLAAGDVQVLDRAPEADGRIAGSSCASVMSDLRSPCFQLLHISHWASQTQVQL